MRWPATSSGADLGVNRSRLRWTGREIEDTATLTSPLIPWNSCGAHVSGTLGIETIAYFPFAFFNPINPLLSFVYAFFGFQIKHIEPGAELEMPPGEASFCGIGSQNVDEVSLKGD